MILYFDKDKYIGFAGEVKLFKKKVYIDTKNGTGYNLVIQHLSSFISYLMSKYNLHNIGFSKNDTRQHIVMRILEGIPKFDPTKNTKLSTFLYMRVERRLINEIRNSSSDFRNPTILNISLYSIVCKCGNKFTLADDLNKDIRENTCNKCGSNLKEARIFSINKPALTFGEESIKFMLDDCYTLDDILDENGFNIPLIYGEKKSIEDNIVFKHDILDWLPHIDNKTSALIEMICFGDMSVKSAADKVGISHTGASNRLKALSRKKRFKEMLANR